MQLGIPSIWSILTQPSLSHPPSLTPHILDNHPLTFLPVLWLLALDNERWIATKSVLPLVQPLRELPSSFTTSSSPSWEDNQEKTTKNYPRYSSGIGSSGSGGSTISVVKIPLVLVSSPSTMLLCANPPLSSLLTQSSPAASYLSQGDLLLIPWNSHHHQHQQYRRSTTAGNGSGNGGSGVDEDGVDMNLALTSIEYPPYQHSPTTTTTTTTSTTSNSITTLPHHAIFRDLVVGYTSPSTSVAVTTLMGTKNTVLSQQPNPTLDWNHTLCLPLYSSPPPSCLIASLFLLLFLVLFLLLLFLPLFLLLFLLHPGTTVDALSGVHSRSHLRMAIYAYRCLIASFHLPITTPTTTTSAAAASANVGDALERAFKIAPQSVRDLSTVRGALEALACAPLSRGIDITAVDGDDSVGDGYTNNNNNASTPLISHNLAVTLIGQPLLGLLTRPSGMIPNTTHREGRGGEEEGVYGSRMRLLRRTEGTCRGE